MAAAPNHDEATVISARKSRVRTRRAHGDSFRIALLSAVAGYVDAAGFVLLFGLFPAHLTGELVVAATAISRQQLLSEAPRLLIVPVFMGAVAMGTLVARITRRRLRGNPLPPLFALMAFALSLCCAAPGLALGVAPAIGNVSGLLQAGGAVSAMALQGVIMREAHHQACPTTVMTGNLTQFLIECVELLADRLHWSPHRAALNTAKEQRLPLVTLALGTFLGSAALGGYLALHWGAVCIALPALMVAGMCVRELRLS